jgi:predicted HAD superfamily Cof-like phosphohydrolase
MTKLQEQLIQFHLAVGQPILPSPAVPTDERIRLRLRLIVEEMFEVIEATVRDPTLFDPYMNGVQALIGHCAIRVDLPKLADALGDTDYVVEGTRLEFGIDGEPIADEIHRTNMAKVGSQPVTDEHGKILKPPGWRPPDIAGELEHQKADPENAGIALLLSELEPNLNQEEP